MLNYSNDSTGAATADQPPRFAPYRWYKPATVRPRTTLTVETPRTDAFMRDVRDKLRQYALLDCIAAARRHASEPPRSEASDNAPQSSWWHASTDCQPSWPSWPSTPAYSVCSPYILSRLSTPLTAPSASACSYPSSRATTPSSPAAGPMTDYSGQYGLPESPSISSVSSTSPTSPVSPSSNASSLSPASSGSTTSTGSSHCQREIISISSRSIISISSTDAREAAYFNVATTPALLSNSTGSQLVGLGLSGVMMPGSHARSLSPVARRKRSFDEFDDEDEDDFERRPSPRSVRPRLGQSPTTCSRELSPTHVAQQQRQPQNRRSAAIVYIDLTQSDSESYCSSPSSYSDVELPPLQLPG